MPCGHESEEVGQILVVLESEQGGQSADGGSVQPGNVLQGGGSAQRESH